MGHSNAADLRRRVRKNESRALARSAHVDKYADRPSEVPDAFESLLSALVDQYPPEYDR